MFEILFDVLPLILVLAGAIGLLYGVDRLTKRAKHESGLFKYIALATSIIIGLVNVVLIFEWKILATATVQDRLHWLTILLIFIAGSSMLAESLKETPLAAVIAIIAFGALSGLFLFTADFSDGFANPEVLGIVPVPLSLVILVIVVLVGIIFLLTFLTEFTVDKLLDVIGWSPIVIVFSALLLVQGALIFVLTDAGGIWALLGL
ncbi:MAG: hypothetical protein ACFFE8_07625 [Candidatus Heimdallarchaeota archaeon]